MEFIKLTGPAGMFFIMFSLALSLKMSAFAGVFKNPISFYLGLICQLIGMPFNWFYYCANYSFPNGSKSWNYINYMPSKCSNIKLYF